MVIFKEKDATAMHQNVKDRLARGEPVALIRQHNMSEASVRPERPYVPKYQVHKVVLGRTRP